MGNGMQRNWCNKNKHGTSEQEVKGRIRSAKTKTNRQIGAEKNQTDKREGGKEKKKRGAFSSAGSSVVRIRQPGLACGAPNHENVQAN